MEKTYFSDFLNPFFYLLYMWGRKMEKTHDGECVLIPQIHVFFFSLFYLQCKGHKKMETPFRQLCFDPFSICNTRVKRKLCVFFFFLSSKPYFIFSKIHPYAIHKQKKKEEEKAREKELNDLFKIAISQPKVPVGMFLQFFLLC